LAEEARGVTATDQGVSVAEAAERLGVSEPFVADLIACGELAQVSDTGLVRAEDLVAFERAAANRARAALAAMTDEERRLQLP
jgi:excisionase family DNA binding protein